MPAREQALILAEPCLRFCSLQEASNWGTPQFRVAPRLGQLRSQPSGRVEMQLLDGAGLSWRLERSSDLANWISLFQTNPGNSAVTLVDDGAGPRSFYRTAWP